MTVGLDALAAFSDGAALLSNGANGAVVAENSALIDIANALQESRWFDIAPALRRMLGREHLASAEIPALLSLPAPGPAHDALTDARAIAAGLRHLRTQRHL